MSGLGGRHAGVRGGGHQVDGAGVDQVAQLQVGQGPLVLDALAAFQGISGRRLRERGHPVPARRDGNQVGLRK